MNVEQLKLYCLSLPGSETKEIKHPGNLLSYSLLGKKFAYFKTSQPEQWRFSFKASPAIFMELTDQEGFKPARFMGRFFWVTAVNVNEINEDYLKSLIEYSYQAAFTSLPKYKQASIKDQF